MQDKIEDLRQRKEQAINAGSPRSVERQHEKGKMLARERIEYLLDPGRSRNSTCWPATVRTPPVWRSAPTPTV